MMTDSYPKYLVRVHCSTYNHVSYITYALNGFVMQKTEFPFVCTIVDDASTDGEQDVIKEYMQEHFDMQNSSVAYEKDTDYGHVTFAQHKTNKHCYFAVVYLKENHFSQKKSKLPYITEWMDTKYNALCEGDDYWTEPLKLQRQVDFLETHDSYMLCVCSAKWLFENSEFLWGCQETNAKDFSVEDLIRNGGLFFATASFVYKAELDKCWPEWRKKSIVGDFPLQILSGLCGGVHYIPETMCVYRYQADGSWTSSIRDDEQKLAYAYNKIEWMNMLDVETNFKFQQSIYVQLFHPYNVLYNHGKLKFRDYIKAIKKSGEKRYGRAIKDFVRIKMRPLYSLLSFLYYDHHRQ